MPRYRAVAHIRWEMPFPIGIKPMMFPCWEPTEGVAFLEIIPGVGSLQWSRVCGFLDAKKVFTSTGLEQDPKQYPSDNYLVTCQLSNGIELPTLHFKGGKAGGFTEARPYCVMNLFLCLRSENEYKDNSVLDRATAAINNLVSLYRFFTMDPLPRQLNNREDTYYTITSQALIPKDWPEMEVEKLLRRIPELNFGHEVGQNRKQTIGINSLDDLVPAGELVGQRLDEFAKLVRSERRLEVYHQLFLSTIRRIKRKEYALAVVDAQSAFESLVAAILLRALQDDGMPEVDAIKTMAWKGKNHNLKRRLEKLDECAKAVAAKSGAAYVKFEDSKVYIEWKDGLYDLRNQIVHAGRREVSFDEAKRALVAGLNAIYAIQALAPSFNRSMMWEPPLTDMAHLKETSGRLFRIFET